MKLRPGVINEAFDKMLPQLVITLVKKFGVDGVLSIAATEIDNTGQDLLHFGVDEKDNFVFVVKKKN